MQLLATSVDKIINDSVLQQLARQAPAAQVAAGACLAGYYN